MKHLKAELYQLNQSDSRIFAFVQEVALDGLWFADLAASDEVWLNPRFWRTLGCDVPANEAVLWSEVHAMVHPEEQARFLKFLDQCHQSAPFAIQEALFRYRCQPKGAWIWLQCKAQKITGGAEGDDRWLWAHNDVTAIKEREALLTRCNTEAKIGYWEFDVRTEALFWSDMTKVIHELPLDHQPDRQADQHWIVAEHRPLLNASIQTAVEKGTPYAIELLLQTPSGRKKWTKAIGVPELVEGVCTRLYGTFQDIDEQKRHQLARLESEQKFKGILDSAFSFIGLLTPDGILQEANQTSLSMAGLERTDVIGKFFWECYWWQISESTRQTLRENIQAAAQGQECVYEVEVWLKDQKPTTILFSLRPVFDTEGNVVLIVPEGRPIQDIVDARHRYLSVIEATQAGTWEWNVQTGETVFNERWASMMGYTLAELMPTSVHTWSEHVHPEDLIEAQKQLEACFRRDIELYDIECRMRHKAGHWIWVQACGQVLSWTVSGKPLMMYGTHQEITSRKQSEAELQHLLALTKNQNERLKNFARIVSHNLRSHAFSIQGSLDVLRLQNPELSEHLLLKMLRKASVNLTETIQDLSEVVASDLPVMADKIPLPLYEVVRKNIESMGSLADKAQVDLRNEVPRALLVPAIPAYLNSLVLNFITNGIKYRCPDREDCHVTVSAHTEGDHHVICFQDNGLGIDLEAHGDKLFRMYQTFHEHEDSRGIGLYITRNQIESMGGRVEVESTVNQGTQFRVFLPC